MFPTIDSYLDAELSYRREQLTRSWFGESVFRRGLRTGRPRTSRHHRGDQGAVVR